MAARTAEETAVIKALGDAFPTVTSVRVKDALDAVDSLVSKLVLALRGASSITLIAAALVLGGALAAGQRYRVYDAVVLKILGRHPGAAHGRLRDRISLDRPGDGHLRRCRGLACRRSGGDPGDGFSLCLGGRRSCVTATAALLVTVAFGLAGTFSALGRKPAEVLQKSLIARASKTIAVKHHERFVTLAKPSRNMASHPSGARDGFRTQFRHSVFRRSQRQPGMRPDNPGVLSMSDFDRNFATARTGYRSDQVAIDAGLRAHMIRVYNYMTAGVALTGIVAWFTFSTPTVTQTSGWGSN